MASAAVGRRRRRGHPGGARLVVGRRPHRRGRLARHLPRRASRSSTPTSAPRCCGLLDRLVADDHEIVTVIEGDGPSARRHPAHLRVARGAPPRRRGRGPPRRPAALPVPLRHRVDGEDARATLAELSRSTDPQGRRAATGRRRSSELGDRRTVLDLLTHYPRRWIDQTKQAAIARPRARARRRLGVRARSCRRRRCRRTRDGQGRMVELPTSPTAPGTCSITFFNQPWRDRQLPAGSEVAVLRQGRRLPRAAADGEPGVDLLDDDDRPRSSPVYPQSDKLRLYSHGTSRGWVGRGARAAPATSSTRARRRPRPSSTSIDRHGRVQRHPPPRVDGGEGRRPQAARVRRAAPHPARPRAAQAGLRAHRAAASATTRRRRARRPLRRAAAVRAHRARSAAAIAEIPATSPGRTRCTACCRATSASGKTVVAVAAMLTAVQGGHQGALMAPTEVLAEQHAMGIRRAARRLHRRRRRRTPGCCSTSARSPSSCSRTARRPRSASGCSPASPTAPSTSSSAPTRSSRRASGSGRSASSSSTSSTASASSSGRRCGTKGDRRRACPTCS